MAIYVTKGFSLRYHGEKLISIMDEHSTAMKRIQKDESELLTSYKGTLLDEKLVGISEKKSALRAKTSTSINELEEAGLISIDQLVKSPKPTDVVQEDLMLLDDRIFPVEQSVFDRLAETYKNNFTMTQALCKYAEQHAEKSGEVVVGATYGVPMKRTEGTIYFEYPMTVQQAKDTLMSATSICSNSTKDGAIDFGVEFSATCGSIKAMIDMG